MTDKKLVIGALAVLLIGVVAAVVFWPEGSTQLVDQGTGARAVVEPAPADVEPLTGTVEDEQAEALQSAVERELVEADPLTSDDAASSRILVVRGVVRDPEQQPVAEVSVRLGQQRATTTDVGSYELTVRTRRDRESLQLIAEGDGWVAAVRWVEIVGEELTADFALRPAFIVSGRVTDPGGAGIAKARVWTFRNLQRPALTDAEGYFRLADLDPEIEKLYLEASAKGYVAKGEMVEVTGERREGVVLELSPGAVVRGIVQDMGQEPVAGAALVITTGKSKSQNRIEAESDAAGRFEFSGVPRGRHQLDVTHGELAAATQEVDVPAPGRTLDVVVELSVGRMLRGLVRAGSGGPIAGAKVNAHDPGNAKRSGRSLRGVETDAQGLFELQGLPLGALRLSCDAKGFVPARWEIVDPGAAYREIVLEPAARIAGSVVDAFTGEPIQAFTIRLRGAGGKNPKGGKWDNWGKRGVLRFTDELGLWDTRDTPLRAGATADVEVMAKGYAQTLVEGLVARVDASYDDNRIALSSGATLAGTVETEAGAPLADARLRLVQGGDGNPMAGKGGRNNRFTSRSDAAGRFAFDSVPHGELRIVVEHSENTVFVHETQVPVGASEWHVTIRVTGQGELRGIVRAPDGQPAAEVDIALTAVEVPGLGGRTWRSKSDTAGQFVFRDLPYGVYRVARTETMVGKRLETHARHVTVTGTTPLEIELRASGVATVRGTLIADFAVPDGAIVQLIPKYADDVPAAERSAPRFTRIRNGAFLFEGVDPGPHRLQAWCQNPSTETWHTGEADAEVRASGETRVDVTVSGN